MSWNIIEGEAAAKVRLIGNSVAPNVAEALVRANCRDAAMQEAG